MKGLSWRSLTLNHFSGMRVKTLIYFRAASEIFEVPGMILALHVDDCKCVCAVVEELV